MALDFTTSLIKLNNQYTIVGSAEGVDPTTRPKKGELYFMEVKNGERICKIGDGETELQYLPAVGAAPLAADFTAHTDFGRYKANSTVPATGKTLSELIESAYFKASEGLAYTLNVKGTAYSVTKGTCTDTNIVIASEYEGKPVTSIGNNAFKDCSYLESIVIPEGVTNINGSAFYGCSSLKSIELPKSITTIGGSAFINCTSLESITIPDGVKRLDAFSSCTSLKSITIPNSVTSIGKWAFQSCSSLTSVAIPDGVTSIGDYAFQQCTGLTSVTIPDSVTSIGLSAFNGCTNLTIYCEAETQPEDWSGKWNPDNRPVVWGYINDFKALNSQRVIKPSEGTNSLVQVTVEDAVNNAYGENSVALGIDGTAGAKGYYVSYVYINDTQTGGKIYLSNIQQTPTIASVDGGVVDSNFVGAYDSAAVGQYFTLVLDENFDAGATSLAKITSISNNVVEFEGYFLDGNHNKITGNYVPASLEYPVLDDFSFLLPSQANVGSNIVRDKAIAIGKSVTALGIGSTALGNNTQALGKYTHTQGSKTTAYAYCATAEGQLTKAFGLSAHAEGFGTEAHGNQSHAEGGNSKSYGSSSHAEGSGTNATGHSSHSEGTQTTAEGENAHAEGFKTKALKAHSHAEGGETTANYAYAHAEGCLTTAESQAAHAEGYNTKATGWISHAEGNTTQAKGANGSHAEGQGTIAEGERSHAEGLNTVASGSASHAEGNGSKATSQQAHAEGQSTTASGGCSHAEGTGATASGWASHAEGNGTTASGDNGAHAEGYSSQATATAAHAEGQNTVAEAIAAHAEGIGTIANQAYQHAQGKYNTVGNFAHIIGAGTSNNNRKNIHTVDWSGNAWFAKDVRIGGTSYDDAEEIATKNHVSTMITPKHMILKSSTSGSNKKFQITVNDSGTLSAKELFNLRGKWKFNETLVVPEPDNTNKVVGRSYDVSFTMYCSLDGERQYDALTWSSEVVLNNNKLKKLYYGNSCAYDDDHYYTATVHAPWEIIYFTTDDIRTITINQDYECTNDDSLYKFLKVNAVRVD